MSKAYGKPNRVVIALGGNALGNTPEERIARVRAAAPTLLRVIEQGNEIIITHGNGPQVGMIQNAFAYAHKDDPDKIPAMDLPECGAMSQGYIGYHLQQALGVAMHKEYKRWHVATVVTQIEVDPDDPAFTHPTKPIGAFMTKEEADAEQAKHPDWTMVEDSGRGYRRVVASPQPKKIVEYESILNLLDNEFIVIACGGGGIPVVRDYNDKGAYKGVAAVIDKDMGGELLAEDCSADMLVLSPPSTTWPSTSASPTRSTSRTSPSRRPSATSPRASSARAPWSRRSAPPSSSPRSRPGPHLHHRLAREGRRGQRPASPAPASTRSR